MHMNNRNDENTNCERDRECVCVCMRIYINMYDDGLERSEFKLNWTNERTIKRTNERSKERTQNGNQNYWTRVLCIDTVIHSTFLFKLVGLFVDGNVFSFDLICGYSVVVCVTHFLHSTLARKLILFESQWIEWKASARQTIFHDSIGIAPSPKRLYPARCVHCTLAIIYYYVCCFTKRTNERAR